MSNNFHYAFYIEYYEKLFCFLYGNEEEEGRLRSVKDINESLVNYEFDTDVLKEKKNERTMEDCLGFDLRTGYPGLLIGIGNQHESKQDNAIGELVLGLLLDYVTGFPYIPGSSIKGVLRSAFNEKVKNHQEYVMELMPFNESDIMWDENKLSDHGKKVCSAFEEVIFEGKIDGENIPMSERDIFYDAYVTDVKTGNKIILMDNIAPHHKKMDSLKEEQMDFSEPEPINFIKVGPEVTFTFWFSLKDSKVIVDQQEYILTKKEKRDLFETIIKDFGIGAKTNVGYGALDD